MAAATVGKTATDPPPPQYPYSSMGTGLADLSIMAHSLTATYPSFIKESSILWWIFQMTYFFIVVLNYHNSSADYLQLI